MGARVAVAGASGYAGGELLRLLAGHPDLEIGPLSANSNAGTPVTEAHPQLTGHPGLDGAVFAGTDPDVLADADLLFTALPHGESAQLAARLPAQLKVIDLGADFRLADPEAWAGYYPTPYAGQWTYGLPELPGARDAIRASATVAAPGCYATASILALAPLLAAGLAEPADIVIVAASGTSGAGRSPRPDLLATEVLGSMSAYQVGGTHRHTPEIEQNIDPERAGLPASAPVTVSFTPTLAPMARGILATCTARSAASAGQLREALGRGLPRGILRARAARGPVAGHRRHPRLQRRPPAGGGRPACRPCRRRLRTGQPGQGRGRPGHPDRQSHARPAGDRRPDRTRSRTMSVTAPLGFRAAGVTAGLKQSGQPDVAVVLNDGPTWSAAAVFTANRVQAAPVTWTRQVVKGGRVRAVVLNSGGANACTGPLGFQDTHATAEHLAAALGDVGAGEIAVCSTGLIGERLPMDKLLPGVDAAVADASRAGGLAAADAIRTTDTVVKIAFRRGTGYTIGGMAKGAGMLAPGLATMLCVLTTDAELAPAELDAALRAATAVTFDRLDTDGCMSTNDTVLLMASGAAGVSPEKSEFILALTEVCADLARQLQLDAEGAEKMITIEVVGAASEADAVTAGRAVARNNLLKCAIGGEDPNWGRVLAAVGTTDAVFQPDRLNVAINGIWVCRHGAPGDERSKVDLKPKDVTITVDLSAGPHSAAILTTDLTAAYVHENSAYST